METLIIQSNPFNGKFTLRDSKGNFLGWFDSEASAREWCRMNGYRAVKN